MAKTLTRKSQYKDDLTLNEWTSKNPAETLNWSQKTLLAVGWGSNVSIYSGIGRNEKRKRTHMQERFPSETIEQVQFCPFEDVLGVGHSGGFSSLIIPGSGEANFNSLKADPFENKSQAAQGKSGEEEILDVDDDVVQQNGMKDQSTGISVPIKEKEKKKMRGKNSSLKRVLRKKHKNVITPEAEALRAKIALRKQQTATLKSKETSYGTPSGPVDALSRFSNKK
ncbi:uncharacterized protein MELLADRAFT_92544 [Melampsora larici-populina 98AG31]|uniref:BING4 C-terminal domain-containing protein n=1 Tax=Melampsora larici-populina (strain 98AG31 / pathotype 3-4-7) TaxID=747676 RepID=F4S1X7_MELLP|nr:uncharacterized protein MELLADRAFT_92544 [Melampsora larici-populina 98AG31]EGG01269.1 hypothetical protein MELLADRAFT_92544 [Melampsora larici-populina 98AG31]